jgi:purine catabolism regulator
LQSVDTLVHERGREPDGGDARGGWRGADEGGVLVFGPAGRLIARYDPGERLTEAVVAELGRELRARQDARPHLVTHAELSEPAYARPVMSAAGGRTHGWIVVAAPAGRVDESVRLIAQETAAVVGLELARRGTASETERRLTGALIADAIAGRIPPAEVERRLTAFGIEGEVAVAVFVGAGPDAEAVLRAALAADELPAAISTQRYEGRELLCAVVEVGERDPVAVVAAARGRVAEEVGIESLRAAVGRERPAADLSRTFQEAYWALGAGGGLVGSWHDLGVEALLLAVGDPDFLRLYCDRLLGPVLADDSVYAAELLRSLELFILHNGQWERASRELHCHRHTLRYRIRKVEELTGRDLSSATDRIEFWLALRARELSHRGS